jgi:hypothetical protein
MAENAKRCYEKSRETRTTNDRTQLTRLWWAGFMVLMSSIVLLSLCTFLKVENKELVGIWENIFFASLGYVLGIPSAWLRQTKA